MALADGMAGPYAGGLARRPVVASARHSLREAAEQAGANARQLAYMLLERAHDDLTDCPGESHGDGLGATRGDALLLRADRLWAFRRLTQDRIVFNVCEGLEMHGERG
jgi:serine/threonine protein phosphatase PrpC